MNILYRLLCLLPVISAATYTEVYYMQRDDFRNLVPGDDTNIPVSSRTASSCLMRCSLNKSICYGAHYKPITGDCYLNTLPLNPGSDMQTYIDTDWKVALRTSTGSGVSVYEVWMIEGTDMQNPILDTTDPTVVKVSMYKNREEVMYTVFDAAGSNKTSWFDVTRIISSSYTDIQPENVADGIKPYFSVQGDATIFRSFFATGTVYSHCSYDRGWFMVSDMENAGPCAFDGPSQPGSLRPNFLYVSGSNRGPLIHALAADVFIITVKF